MNSSLGVQLFPYPFRHPTTDLPLANGTVLVTLASVATLAPTYADAALVSPNPNPLTLDPSGYAQMFFSPLNGGTAGVAYDVIVKDAAGAVQWIFQNVAVPVPTAGGNATSIVIGAGVASTLTIAGGVITPTKNLHLISPEGGAPDFLDSIAITAFPEGGRLTISNTNGAAAITVRNNVGNIFTPDGLQIVLSSPAQRLSLIRYGPNFWVDDVANTSVVAVPSNLASTGRLTLVSGVPVPDVTGATSVYYTPYTGDVIDLFDDTTWRRHRFAELAYPLGSLAADTVHDVFAYDNAGIVTLAVAAWLNSSTRQVPLTRQNGILVVASNLRYRYLGTICMAVAGSTNDTLEQRFVWNYYNRVRRPMRRIDPNGSWVYNVATYRQANGADNGLNRLDTVIGISEDAIEINVRSRVTKTNAAASVAVSIGLNAIAPMTGAVIGGGSSTTAASEILNASVVTQPSEGRNVYVWLERGDSAGVTWEGTGTSIGTLFDGGISGTVIG